MNIIFNLRDKNSKDTTPIEFTINISVPSDSGKNKYQQIRRSTGLQIKPKYWNEKTKLAKDTKEFNGKEINIKLLELVSYVNDIEKQFHEAQRVLTALVIKEKLDVYFHGDKDKFNAAGFFEFADHVISTKEKKQHKRILNQTLRVLKEFAKTTKYRVDFETITIDFYDLFLSYLNKRGYATNTKAKHISNVKYFMNESLQKKLHTNTDFKSTKFKVTKERVQNIYLTDAEIQKIYELDYSKNLRLDRARDLFLIGCYTGLRFSDFSQIVVSNINQNILSIQTQKTGTFVKIPLRPQVQTIFTKYGGGSPKAISNQKLNKYLKEIAKDANINEPVLKYKNTGTVKTKETKLKYELVCTHTARRSFATNCYKANLPAKQIMLITGHTTESEFFKYIQINEEENAELLLKNNYFSPVLKVV